MNSIYHKKLNYVYQKKMTRIMRPLLEAKDAITYEPEVLFCINATWNIIRGIGRTYYILILTSRTLYPRIRHWEKEEAGQFTRLAITTMVTFTRKCSVRYLLLKCWIKKWKVRHDIGGSNTTNKHIFKKIWPCYLKLSFLTKLSQLLLNLMVAENLSSVSSNWRSSWISWSRRCSDALYISSWKIFFY